MKPPIVQMGAVVMAVAWLVLVVLTGLIAKAEHGRNLLLLLIPLLLALVMLPITLVKTLRL